MNADEYITSIGKDCLAGKNDQPILMPCIEYIMGLYSVNFTKAKLVDHISYRVILDEHMVMYTFLKPRTYN